MPSEYHPRPGKTGLLPRALAALALLAAPAAHADVVFEITEEPDGIRATVVAGGEDNKIGFFAGETQENSVTRSEVRLRVDADSGRRIKSQRMGEERS